MDSSGQLIAARGRGCGDGVPSRLSLLTSVFTERGERARAIGLWGAITGAAIALGPIVGGGLLEVSGWRSIFSAMAPIAASPGVLVARYIPPARSATAISIEELRMGQVLSPNARTVSHI